MKYYRCPNPDSYYTVEGDTVTYFAPHVPNGYKSDETPEFMERLSKRTPLHAELFREITEEQAGEVRARLMAVVDEVEKANAYQAMLEASKWRSA